MKRYLPLRGRLSLTGRIPGRTLATNVGTGQRKSGVGRLRGLLVRLLAKSPLKSRSRMMAEVRLKKKPLNAFLLFYETFCAPMKPLAPRPLPEGGVGKHWRPAPECSRPGARATSLMK